MTTQDPASPNGDLHVIFGAGQVGPLLAQHLLDAGHRVRVVRRGNQSIAPQIELISGDATDREFCAGAAMGGSVVYHCMNPAEYNAKIWADLVPKYMDNLIAAARTAGARLVVLDNLYMLGRPNGKPLTEKTPVNPCSKKGEIRAKTAEKLFAAHNKGEVAAITGRASDFYGPRARLGFLGDPFWKPALSGRKVRTPINPDAVHTYHYVPDVAAGLAALGSAPLDAYGKSWMLPCQPAETMRQLAGRLSKYLGKPINVAKLPSFLLKAAGMFVPIVRELNEMRYQWDEPFIVDDTAFRAKFGLTPIDRDQAAKATVEWARAAYAKKG